MKIWVIKHKGANYWRNFELITELTFQDGSKIFCDRCFYRKKDAKKVLETYEYKEFFEVVRFILDRPNKLN